MLGTKKGAFESRDDRRTWKSSGFHFKGTSAYHVAFDQRGGTMLAAVDNFVSCPTVAKSHDLGRIFFSRNGGRRWSLVADGLSPTFSVSAATV